MIRAMITSSPRPALMAANDLASLFILRVFRGVASRIDRDFGSDDLTHTLWPVFCRSPDELRVTVRKLKPDLKDDSEEDEHRH